MHTLAQSYKAVSLIRPVVATATATGSGVDLLGFLDDAMAIVDFGVLSGTAATNIVTIEGSNDNSAFTVLTTFVAASGTDDAKIASGRVNLTGYRYVRAVATIAGTTPSYAFGVTLLVRAEAGLATLNSLTAA